jgi:hypothetical protein
MEIWMRKTTTIQQMMNNLEYNQYTKELTQNLPLPPSWEAITKLIPSISILELDFVILDDSTRFLFFDIVSFTIARIMLGLRHLGCHDVDVSDVLRDMYSKKIRGDKAQAERHKKGLTSYTYLPTPLLHKPPTICMAQIPYPLHHNVKRRVALSRLSPPRQSYSKRAYSNTPRLISSTAKAPIRPRGSLCLSLLTDHLHVCFEVVVRCQDE